MQTSRAEQAHDSRHLCMRMSHVRFVPLTLTMRFYQPRAGYVIDAAVLAKPRSRKAVTPAKAHILLVSLIKLIRQGWDNKTTTSKFIPGASFRCGCGMLTPPKHSCTPRIRVSCVNEIASSLKYIHTHFLPKPVVTGGQWF